MEYTNYYRLPQWAESDRIMMTDFNAAMAALESGLLEGRERSFRQAYNHYCLTEAAGGQVRQKGLFRQEMQGDALPEGAAGMVAQGDFCWVSAGQAATTAAMVRESVVVVRGMLLTKGDLAGCWPMVITFSVQDGPCRMNQLNLTGSFNSNEGCKGLMRLVLKNQTTGETEVDKIGSLTADVSGQTSGTGVHFIHPDLYLRGGCSYQLEVTPVEDGYNVNFGYSYLVTQALSVASGSVTRDLQEEEGSRGGVALVRYRTHGQGGTLALDWDGETLSPKAVRSFTGPDGLPTQEAEFRKDGPVPASSTLTLRLAATPVGGLSLFDWGAVLI